MVGEAEALAPSRTGPCAGSPESCQRNHALATASWCPEFAGQEAGDPGQIVETIEHTSRITPELDGRPAWPATGDTFIDQFVAPAIFRWSGFFCRMIQDAFDRHEHQSQDAGFPNFTNRLAQRAQYMFGLVRFDGFARLRDCLCGYRSFVLLASCISNLCCSSLESSGVATPQVTDGVFDELQIRVGLRGCPDTTSMRCSRIVWKSRRAAFSDGHQDAGRRPATVRPDRRSP